MTFVLTDVENSTRLYAVDPREAARALRRQEELIAAAVPARRGTLPSKRGEGDSTFAVFTRATDALACALEVQRAMEREDWPASLQVRVRMALHAGEADPGAPDWRGVAVNRCARIRALAHGGQVLVSGAVRELAGEDLPAGAGLRDLGPHRLPDSSARSGSSSSPTPTCNATSHRFAAPALAATTCRSSSPASSGADASSTSSRRCWAKRVSSR